MAAKVQQAAVVNGAETATLLSALVRTAAGNWRYAPKLAEHDYENAHRQRSVRQKSECSAKTSCEGTLRKMSLAMKRYEALYAA